MGCCFSSACSEEPGEQAFEPLIGLSEKHKAQSLTVDGSTISGTGSVLGDSPILQDKSYFEASVVKGGTFAMGVATKDTPLDGVLTDKVSSAWMLTNSTSIGEGDTLGCALDQADYPVQVYFYKSNQLVQQLSGVRGEVMPAFSVADGAVLSANFGGSEYASLPPGFQGIIKCKSLL